MTAVLLINGKPLFVSPPFLLKPPYFENPHTTNAEAAAAVAATSLKHMLCSQDAVLGPWLPGRELLEDELRTFSGESAMSQQRVRMSCMLSDESALGQQ